MSLIVIFGILLVLFQAQAAPLSSEQEDKLREYSKECLQQFNLNDQQIQQTRNGLFLDDIDVTNYLFCFSKKLGFQDSKGLIQKIVYQQKLNKLLQDETLVAKLVEECAVDLKTPEETAFNLAKCTHKAVPDLHLYQASRRIVYLPNEIAEKNHIACKECAQIDPLGKDVIEQAIKQDKLFEDEKFANYFYCFNKKVGFQLNDGTINKEKVSNCIKNVIQDKDEAEKLIEQCLQQQETPETTAFFMNRCIKDKSPVIIKIFPREIEVPKEVATILIQNSRECYKETKVDINVLIKARQGVFENDTKFKQYTLCLAKKSKLITDDGNLKLDVLRFRLMILLEDIVIVNKLVEECAIKKSTPEDSAFSLYECLGRRSPGHLNIRKFGMVAESRRQKYGEIVKDCRGETDVPEDILAVMKKGDLPNEPILKQFLYCVTKKSGLLEDTGSYRIDVLKQELKDIFNEDEANWLIGKCLKKLIDPVENSYESIRCLIEEAPELLLSF